MRDQYIKSGDGFLLVYSITDHSSSHSVTAFHEQIIAARGEKDKIIPQIPLVLVGNKVRLNIFFCMLAWPLELPAKLSMIKSSLLENWKREILPQIPIVLIGNTVRLTFFFLYVCFCLSVVVVGRCDGDLSFRYPFRMEASREFLWRVAILFVFASNELSLTLKGERQIQSAVFNLSISGWRPRFS